MTVRFFYDFASSYSYLAVMRIGALANAAGVAVAWKPFLLGPIFKEAGYDGSPNLTFPAKADYMWRDIGRRAAHRGLPFVAPTPFPQRSVSAGRMALALAEADRPGFSRAVFHEQFGRGLDIANPAVLADAARAAGLDADGLAAAAAEPAAKEALFAAVAEAKEAGVFGAPTFVTSTGEVFWGDDRLEDAIAWERTGALHGFAELA